MKMGPVTVGYREAPPRERRWWRTLLHMVTACGAIVLIMLALAFTPLPDRWYRWFAAIDRAPKEAPQILAVIGSDLPSESSLWRAYTAACAAEQWPQATIFVLVPNGREPDRYTGFKLRRELVLRGVDASRIRLETTGNHIAALARTVAGKLGEDSMDLHIGVVSSRQLLRRTLWTFERAGFTDTSAIALGDAPGEIRTLAEKAVEDDRPWVRPDERGRLLQHRFWHNLHCEVGIARELTALAYYKLRGWI